MAAVSIVESCQFTTVDVEHGQYGGIIIRRKNGDDNLGTRKAAAGDMARELLDIRDDKRTALLPGRPTDTTPEGNVHTGHRPLKRSQQELIAQHSVKARPEKAHGLMDDAAHIGHHGNSVSLARYLFIAQ